MLNVILIFSFCVCLVFYYLSSRNYKLVNKERQSILLYIRIKNAVSEYNEYYKGLDGFDILKQKINNLDSLLSNKSYLPYENIKVVRNNYEDCLKIIMQQDKEEELSKKMGLPNLYDDISMIYKDINKIYFPRNYFINRLRMLWLFIYIVFHLIINVLSNKFKGTNKKEVINVNRINDDDVLMNATNYCV